MLIFADGRSVDSKDDLPKSWVDDYIEIEIKDLPNIPLKDGYVGYYYADLKTNKVKINYVELSTMPEDNIYDTKEKISSHTLTDLVQTIEDLRVDMIISGVIDNV